MSEADKIIESLKNSGRKVEEFYTGNKTSDKNVANIEKDIKNIKQYINLVLDKSYCDCNELNVISTGKHCDGSKNVAYSMQNILAELEQKDKRIQELEEEKQRYKIAFNQQVEVLKDTVKKLNDSIPKQVVIDKIEEIEIIKQITSKAKYTHLELLQFAINNLEELLEK